jgi:hypothetical protein
MTSGSSAPSWPRPRLLIGRAAIRIDKHLLAAAERWPRMGVALLYVGEHFCRLALGGC